MALHQGSGFIDYLSPARRVGRATRAARVTAQSPPPAEQQVATSGQDQASAAQQAEDLWRRHGASIYALACALLGDEKSATQAVVLGLAEYVRSDQSASPGDARRAIARHIYRRSDELTPQAADTVRLPPIMRSVAQLAQMQRACLALCVFGGHTYQQAASLLGIAPSEAAQALTSGLRQLAVLTPAGTSTCD